ncbi:MAG: FAD-binding protein, partial [Clostridia bacterium]|nr:FAD-binding protein [Clostridia bacterium]
LNISILPGKYLGKASLNIMEAGNRLGHEWEPMPKFINLNKVKNNKISGAKTSIGENFGERWTALEYIEEAVKNGAKLLTSTECTELIVENGVIKGVKAKTKKGRENKYFAKKVVLSGGGIPSPVLLQKAGIKNAGKGCIIDPTILVYGISKNKLAVSSLLEGSLQIIVQFLFALVLLIFDTRLNIISNNIKVIIGLGILACLTVLIPRVFNRIVSVAYKLVKHKDFSDEHTATGKTIAKGFGLYVVGSLISSLSLFFVAKALYPELGYEHIFFVMGASTLAGAVSMVAIFAPSGIGVREGIQLALLSIIMPTEIALVITIVTRLWSVVIDLVFFGISALLYKYKEIK